MYVDGYAVNQYQARNMLEASPIGGLDRKWSIATAEYTRGITLCTAGSATATVGFALVAAGIPRGKIHTRNIVMWSIGGVAVATGVGVAICSVRPFRTYKKLADDVVEQYNRAHLNASLEITAAPSGLGLSLLF